MFFFIFRGEKLPCELSENFPNGYNSSCQQKYIYRKMLALGKNGSTVTDLFKLPSCCSCVVSNPLGIGSRSASFGLENPQTPAKKPAKPEPWALHQFLIILKSFIFLWLYLKVSENTTNSDKTTHCYFHLSRFIWKCAMLHSYCLFNM